MSSWIIGCCPVYLSDFTPTLCYFFLNYFRMLSFVFILLLIAVSQVYLFTSRLNLLETVITAPLDTRPCTYTVMNTDANMSDVPFWQTCLHPVQISGIALLLWQTHAGQALCWNIWGSIHLPPLGVTLLLTLTTAEGNTGWNGNWVSLSETNCLSTCKNTGSANTVNVISVTTCPMLFTVYTYLKTRT